MSDGIDGAATHDAEPAHSANGSAWSSNEFKTKAATVGVVVIGAALIESALIPGIVIGLAAAVAPKYMPQMGAALQPMFRSAVRGAYKFGRKAREAAAEATEQVQDIVAEVHAEKPEAPEAKPHT